jgi:hypothetical protein
MMKTYKEDLKGLYLGGEYLNLVASAEGAYTSGKLAAEEFIENLEA